MVGLKNLCAYAYNTRFEIHDYQLGDIPQLEKDLSLWDDINFERIPKYHYDENTRTLYIPRGYDLYKLETMIGKPVVFKRCPSQRKKANYAIISPPKNSTQKEAVRFLSGLEEYEKMIGESQLVLSLPTSAGKTYCAIAACSVLGVKAIAIVGTDDLRKQWAQKIAEYTQLPKSSICTISGSKTIDILMNAKEKKLANHVFYITTHQTLRSYLKSHGFGSLDKLFEKLGIGIKIVDEAHTQYLNTLLIDYATNVWKTFYLSATFEQSEKTEDRLFQRAFDKVFKLKISPNNRKHVHYIAGIFYTKANAVEKESVMGRKGLDKYKYIEYEFKKGLILDAYKSIMGLLISNLRLEGKILVLSPKKSSCDALKELTGSLFPEMNSCVHYSENKVDDFESYDIIFATSKMLGTGNDIRSLRAIVNLEPIRSERNTIQVFGRLREYAPDKDTYYIELIDRSIPSVASMYNGRKKLLSGLCKSQVELSSF